MATALLFLCLYCSDPTDKTEQTVEVGMAYRDRNFDLCTVEWFAHLPNWDHDDLMIAGSNGLMYRWDRFWQMLRDVPQP